MTPEEKKQLASAVPRWFHSFDFGDGVLTQGHKSPEILEGEWKKLQLPPLHGKSVLDVNTWDGWFAMEAEKANAARVVAIDRHVWCMDLVEYVAYWKKCKEDNVHPRPSPEMPYFRPDDLPGKIGFDTAKRITGSRVEEVIGDFATMDLAPLGQFDVVLYLGTLYHMMDPIGNLKRLFQVTAPGGLAVVETHAVATPGLEHIPICECYGPLNTLEGDSSNWWGPNALALRQMLLAAGFSSVEIIEGPSQSTSPSGPGRRAALRALLPQPVRSLVKDTSQRPRFTGYRAYAHARK